MDDLLLLIQRAKNERSLLIQLEQQLSALVNTPDQQAIFVLLQSNDPEIMFYSVVVAEKKFKMQLTVPGGVLNSPQLDDLLNFIESALNLAMSSHNRLFINKTVDLAVLAFLCVYPVKFVNFVDILNYSLIENPSSLGYRLLNQCCHSLLHCRYVDFQRKNQVRGLINSNIVRFFEHVTQTFENQLEVAIMNKIVQPTHIPVPHSAVEYSKGLSPRYNLDVPSHVKNLTFRDILRKIVNCYTDFATITKKQDYRHFVYKLGIYCQEESLFYYDKVLSVIQDYRVAEEIIQATTQYSVKNIQKVACIIADTAITSQLKLFFQSIQIINFIATNLLSVNFEGKIEFIERAFKSLKNDRDEKRHFATIETVSMQLISIIRFMNNFIDAEDYFNTNSIHNFLATPTTIVTHYAKSKDIAFYNDLHVSIQNLPIDLVEHFEKMQNYERETILNKCLNYLLTFASIHPPLVEFIFSKYTHTLPKNIALVLIKVCQNKPGLTVYSPFQECARLCALKDKDCANFLIKLDYNDKNDIGLSFKILKNNRVPSEILSKLLHIIDSEKADGICISCIAALQRRQQADLIPQNTALLSQYISGDWTQSRKKFFLALLNENKQENMQEYISYFTSLSNEDLDRLLFRENSNLESKNDEALDLKILKKIYKIYKMLPQDVLHRFYLAIPSLSLGAIKNIINDILLVLNEDTGSLFIGPVIERIVNDYADCVKSESIPCIRSMLNLLEKKILTFKNYIEIDNDDSEQHPNLSTYCIQKTDNGSTDSQSTQASQENTKKYQFYIGCLQEMIKIQERCSIHSIHMFVSKHKIPLEHRDALFKLLVLYNSPEMTDAHSDILNFIIYILQFPECHEVFLQLPDTNPEKIQSMLQALHGSSKNKREILRTFLSSVEGKHITHMFTQFKAGKIQLKRSMAP